MIQVGWAGVAALRVPAQRDGGGWCQAPSSWLAVGKQVVRKWPAGAGRVVGVRRQVLAQVPASWEKGGTLASVRCECARRAKAGAAKASRALSASTALDVDLEAVLALTGGGGVALVSGEAGGLSQLQYQETGTFPGARFTLAGFGSFQRQSRVTGASIGGFIPSTAEIQWR